MLIYKITNSVNDKIYIGQTRRTLKERIKNHRCSYTSGKTDTVLYRAMRRYGWDVFHFETICYCESKQQLNFFEKFYIEKYDSYHHGYNMTSGGEMNPMDSDEVKLKHDQKMQTDKVRSSISKTMKQRYKKYGVSDATRHRLSESQTQLYNSSRWPEIRAKFRASYHMSEKHKQAANEAKYKKVYCIDTAGHIVQRFNSVRSAAEWWLENGYDTVQSYRTLCDRIKTSFREDRYIKGLKWIYESDGG